MPKTRLRLIALIKTYDHTDVTSLRPHTQRILEWVRQAWRAPLITEADTVCG